MFRFGNIEVVCEGYDYPDDPFILKGSCGLEYTLDYTMEGELPLYFILQSLIIKFKAAFHWKYLSFFMLGKRFV